MGAPLSLMGDPRITLFYKPLKPQSERISGSGSTCCFIPACVVGTLYDWGANTFAMVSPRSKPRKAHLLSRSRYRSSRFYLPR